jgi:hypothetical protein
LPAAPVVRPATAATAPVTRPATVAPATGAAANAPVASGVQALLARRTASAPKED